MQVQREELKRSQGAIGVPRQRVELSQATTTALSDLLGSSWLPNHPLPPAATRSEMRESSQQDTS